MRSAFFCALAVVALGAVGTAAAAGGGAPDAAAGITAARKSELGGGATSAPAATRAGAATANCSGPAVLDPPDKARSGSDYEGIIMTGSDDPARCIAACCADARCRSFSWNTPNPGDFMGCKAGQNCCLLKDAAPPLGPNKWGKAVRTGTVPRPLPHPVPTARQAEYMDMGLTQFMHFSVTTFGNIEHDCVDGKCLSPSLFNPTNLSTDQWVQTAVDMGAGEICLTAHHEGGFCLWPSEYSNYSVAASPWGKANPGGDIVKQFVASCHKYGVRPCFYIGPNANGYFTQVAKYSPAQFVAAQLGMIKEVLTNYGPISRLWWDHYEDGCGGLSECPGGFPAAWANFTALVRRLSPSTLMGTGPDVGHSLGGESGVGSYPIWNQCDTHGGDPLQRCSTWGPEGATFRPREADATIQNPGDAWFWKRGHAIWNASQIWDHVALTLGRGDNFILNMPPDTTGQIPAAYAAETKKFGTAWRATFGHPVATTATATATATATTASASTSAVPQASASVAGAAPAPAPEPCASARVVLDVPAGATIDTFMSREDMGVNGQRISKYAIEALVGGAWRDVNASYGGGVHGQTVGNRIIDFTGAPIVGATQVAWRCVNATADPVTLRSFGAFKSQRPQ